MPITTTVKLDLDGSGAFATTISQYLLEATIHQGRTKSLDPMGPATATVKLNNADGRFSPDNAGGPYGTDFDDNGVGIRIEAGTRRFTGYIVEIQQDPFIENQEVVLTCTDRLGLLARQTVSCGLFRQQPLHLVLNRVLDCLEGEEITNPGAEGGLATGYSAAYGGGTVSANGTTSFEGDWCIQAICDGTAAQQGIRYDLGAAVATNKKVAVFARLGEGDPDTVFRFRGLTAVGGVAWTNAVYLYDDRWAYLSTNGKTGHRYIELATYGSAAVTILADCLHQVPDASIIARSIPTTLDAEVELFGLYEAPALENLNRLMATEAAGFLYMKGFDSGYGTIYASAQVERDAKTVPSATFGDDGTNVPYVGLAYGLDARERISRAEVRSQGAYEVTTEEATIWQLSPTGQRIPASETKVFQISYSQPARGCVLAVNPAGTATTYPIAASGDDGRIVRYGTGYPPTTPSVVIDNYLAVGQVLSGSNYNIDRTYLRLDTSAIGGGTSLANSRLRLKVKDNRSVTDFTLQVRTKAWGATLENADWDGTGTVLGTFDSADLPPAGEWIEIDIAVAGIQKTAWTEFELTSDREVAHTAPTGDERVFFESFDGGFPPELLVTPVGATPDSIAFESFGVGARAEIGAGAVPLVVDAMTVTGYPFQACSEESVVVADAITPPVMPATLSVEMPCQGTRTADMVAEAARLALRHSGKVRRLPLSLQEQDAASLTQMQTRELDDLVTVINEAFAFSTKINDQFFIEGMEWVARDQGKVLEVIYNLEEK
jgi:hypothetical protein